MKGSIEKDKDIAKSDLVNKEYQKSFEKILPAEFNIIDIIVVGKQVSANMREIMRVANVDSKQQVIESLNEASSYFFYFGRLAVDLESELADKQECFDIFMAVKGSKYVDEKSEAGKERRVMVDFQEIYIRHKQEIKVLTKYLGMVKVAAKALDKNIDILRSIAKLTNEENQGD